MAIRGQPNVSSESLISVSSEVPVLPSELNLSIILGTADNPHAGVVRNLLTVPVTFVWTEAQDGFTRGDIIVRWFDEENQVGQLADFAPADGASIFAVTLTLPDDSAGVVDIIVSANVATATADPTRMGPQATVRRSVVYDNTARQSDTPTVTIRDLQQDPWESRVLPLTMVWSENVSQFNDADVSIDVGTLENFTEEQQDVYTANVMLPDNATGTVTITIRADAAQGSQERGPATAYTQTFNYDTTGANTDIPNTTTLCEDTWTFANHPDVTGASVGIFEMLVHSGYVYFITQIVRDRGSSPVNFLAYDTVGASGLYRVPTSGGTCELLVLFDDVLSGARSLAVFENEVHYFRGSHYAYRYEDSIRPAANPDWRSEVGEIWKLESGAMPTLVGRTGRTGQVQDARPGDDDYDLHYGIRGGTVSPMLATADDLFILPGFGDVRDIGAGLIAKEDVDDIRNWELTRWTEKLGTRLPVLETNGHPGWENLKQLAQVTRSRVGFRGTEFRLEPSPARTAKVETAISDSATTLVLKELSHVDYPNAGTVFIEGELISYANRMNENLLQLTRGAYETTADGHVADAPVVFVDHVFETAPDIRLANKPLQTYNSVKVEYGDDQEYTAEDSASITAHGKNELVLRLPLGAEQTEWAKDIAETYLADLKIPQSTANLTIEMDTDIYIGDVIFIDQTDRAHVFGTGQVVEVKHNLVTGQNNSQTTDLKLVLL